MSNSQSKNPPPSNYKLVGTPPPLESFTPEWALFRFLEPWTPEVMQIAIKKNVEWDLSQHVDTIINYAMEEILKWFEKYRPDLHEVLKTREGQQWLKKNMKESMTPKYQLIQK